jgi:hypothetical protein
MCDLRGALARTRREVEEARRAAAEAAQVKRGYCMPVASCSQQLLLWVRDGYLIHSPLLGFRSQGGFPACLFSSICHALLLQAAAAAEAGRLEAAAAGARTAAELEAVRAAAGLAADEAVSEPQLGRDWVKPGC